MFYFIPPLQLLGTIANKNGVLIKIKNETQTDTMITANKFAVYDLKRRYSL